ncbi:hypothetical protein MLD38_016564 [Melastoma candidum]|uniref:Uncharacterized protein n=1 Tax=Melastoma candidum TaxID=119954 RepID=A0ACB9QP02_9MYRT|nr:hypothetical protein MLD38_016564 [Melastoma candidum]
MVGIFSKFSAYRSSHRRAQSTLDGRGALPSNVVVADVAAAATSISHGVGVAVELKPVEHPVEPLDNDHPIQCPLPEPSILNDGRIWKERVSANARRRTDLPLMPGGGGAVEPITAPKPRQAHSNRTIIPSISAPEHNLLKLLEECQPSVT